MKKYLIMIFMCLVAAVGCSAYGPAETGGGAFVGTRGDVDINFFFDYLSPYGSWVEFSPYGYVWCPSDLGYGWHPYSHGHWVWTDYGWTWMSDYDWGWVPFHYGRWDWDDGLGWFWVPDTVWGPAWVSWCWSDDYIGWAPLPPYADFVAGVGIRLGRPIPVNFWCFVEGPRLLDSDLRRDIFPFERNPFIYSRAVHRENLGFANDRVFDRGVGVDEVRHWTGREVSRYRLEDAPQPGRPRVEGDRVRMYRPPILRSESARPKAFIPRTEAPQRIQERHNQALEESGRRAAAEKAMRDEQDRQRRLLEQSQRRDQEQMTRQHQDEVKRAQDQAAREKANREHQARQEELRREQDRERSQIQQRHEEERRSSQRSKPQGQPKKGKG